MKQLMIITFAITAFALAAAPASAVQVVDDFSASPASSEWVHSVVLGIGDGADFRADNENDNLLINDDHYDYLGQTVFLRDDYTLAPGYTLFTDVVSFSQQVIGAGIVLCDTDSPASPAFEDRNNILMANIMTNPGFPNRVDGYIFDDDGGDPIFFEYNIPGSTGPDDGLPEKLYITRFEDGDTYACGYFLNNRPVEIFRVVNGVDCNFNVNGAIGYFADIRSGSWEAVFDNLEIDQVTYQPKPFDINGDFMIDEVEAAVVAENWLLYDEEFGSADGDFNGDHVVNDIDATILAANWGDYYESPQAVPEPAMTALLICLAIGLIGIKVRK